MASQKRVSFAEPPTSQSISYSLRPPPLRPSNTPFTRSPLRANMSVASANSDSGSSTHDTPTRPSRSTEQTQQTQQTRPRRSSSVPASLHVPTESTDSSRSTSPTFAGNRRSVKHLTCYWWKSKAPCRYSDDECLYAHRDTGKYTDPPRSLVPGEPAKAGRSLQKAMNDLGHPNQTSTSIVSLSRSGATTPGLEMPLIQRPSANIQLGPTRIQTAPANIQAPSYNPANDNAYLRKMLDEARHEKNFFFSTIDSLNVDKDNLQSDKSGLQSDKTALQTTIDRLRVEIDQVTQERDILRGVVHQLQQQLQQRSTSNQYGVPGNHRFNSRGSWASLNSSGLSRPPSAHSEREQEGDYGVIRNLGPNF